MGIENYRPPAQKESEQEPKLGESFGPFGFQRPSPGPLDRLVDTDVWGTDAEEEMELLRTRLSLNEHVEEKAEGSEGRENVYEYDEGDQEHLHESEEHTAGHHHTHGHTHGIESGKIYAGHYEPTPEDMVTGLEREGRFLKGLAWGSAALFLWILDSIVHLSPIPIDDVVVHGLALYCTARALGPLNEGWRGYRIPQEIIKGRKEEYKGEGYPVSSITFARENLRGHYDEGSVKRQYSRYAIGVGFIGKVVGGMVYQISHDVSSIWGYSEGAHREEGIAGFIKYTIEGIGRLAKNLYNDGPITVLGKTARSILTVVPSLGKGLWKGNKRFLHEYKAGGINAKVKKS